MANKIVIFGDSYANSEPVDWSWSNKLKTYYDVVNFAQAGSSDVYSRIQLFDYLQSNEYSEDDVILFFATSLWRMNLLTVFEKVHEQSTYMTHAANILGKFRGSQPLHEGDNKCIKSDPNFFFKYHEYLQKDTLNLYKQRLLHAKLLKDLPNFVVYYDTFYKAHQNVFATNGEISNEIVNDTQIFDDTMLQDNHAFVYVKGDLVYECSKHPEHRMSVQDKIHNHLNKKQNKVFFEQVCKTIEYRRNKFNEQEIFELFD